MKSPGEYEGERRRFVQHGIDTLKKKFLSKAGSTSAPVEKMVHDLETLISEVKGLAKPIQQAGGAVKPTDELALRHHVFEWTLQRFDSWDKTALQMLCTTYVAERLMQDIQSDPWGTGNADMLS